MTERVALETTLLLHGVPKAAALPLARELFDIVKRAGAEPALVGLIGGRPGCALSLDDLESLLEAPTVPKANAANLGLLMHQGASAATTVSATMEIAAADGIRVFATGGLGGVHRGHGQQIDISADLAALGRYPVAVVSSGVKSLLDVAATRELLETLGVPVVGFRTEEFPAFYLRSVPGGLVGVDWAFDDEQDLASFIRSELRRHERGIVVANPISESEALDASELDAWLSLAEDEAKGHGVTGRDVTPFVLDRLHEISNGRTLNANIALVRANAELAARIAAALNSPSPDH